MVAAACVLTASACRKDGCSQCTIAAAVPLGCLNWERRQRGKYIASRSTIKG